MRIKEKLAGIARTFKQEIEVYRRVLKDPRTPGAAKLILGLALAYALSPIDIIPDFIPVLGHLDDVIIVPLLVYLALELIPRGVVEESRRGTFLTPPDQRDTIQSTMNFEKVLNILVEQLDKHRIAYAFIGGFAMGVQGVPRSTVDIDLLVKRDDAARIDALMRSLGYRCAFSSDNVSQYVSPSATFGEVDFLHAFREHSLKMLRRVRERKVFDGKLKVKVLIPEDLIGLKVQAMANDRSRRTSDLADIESLMKHYGNKLDWGLVGEYFGLFEEQEEFSRLKGLYGSAQ